MNFVFTVQLMEVKTMSDKRFLDVNDVAEFMGISTSKAYKIIHELNAELKAAGYITVAGKVSRAYFEQKTFGVAS